MKEAPIAGFVRQYPSILFSTRRELGFFGVYRNLTRSGLECDRVPGAEGLEIAEVHGEKVRYTLFYALLTNGEVGLSFKSPCT